MVVGHDYDLLERRSHARVHRRELLADELLVVGTDDGAEASPVSLDSLADRPWVFPDRGSACDRVVERACAAAGFAPRIIARSSDFTAIVALAQAGDAVALVPDLALDHRTLPAPARPLTTPVRRRIFAAVREGAQRRPLESAVLKALSAATGPPDGPS